MPVNERDLGWIAGILDGEGCFCMFHTKKQWSLRCMVGVTDISLIQRLCSLLGLAYTVKKPRGNRKSRYDVVIPHRVLVEILPLLIPTMTAKRRQAELTLQAIAIQRERIALGRGRTGDGGKGRQQPGKYHRLEDLKQIALDLQSLNRRGVWV